jgi:hypothetical protein
MVVTFSLKVRDADTGQWRSVDVNSVAGTTLAGMFDAFSGKEAVAEFTIGDFRAYFCGNDHWLERMGRKGKSVLFSQAAGILRERCPQLLDEVLPEVATVAGVFEGATLQSVTFGETA